MEVVPKFTAPAIVTLPKVEVPTTVPEPAKAIVPVAPKDALELLLVNVLPVLIVTTRLAAIVKERVAPEPMVRLLVLEGSTEFTVIKWFNVMSTLAGGTLPPTQVLAVFQSPSCAVEYELVLPHVQKVGVADMLAVAPKVTVLPVASVAVAPIKP